MLLLPEIAAAHPMLDDEYCQGTLRIIYELQNYLAEITGLDAVISAACGGSPWRTGRHADL